MPRLASPRPNDPTCGRWPDGRDLPLLCCTDTYDCGKNNRTQCHREHTTTIGYGAYILPGFTYYERYVGTYEKPDDGSVAAAAGRINTTTYITAATPAAAARDHLREIICMYVYIAGMEKSRVEHTSIALCPHRQKLSIANPRTAYAPRRIAVFLVRPYFFPPPATSEKTKNTTMNKPPPPMIARLCPTKGHPGQPLTGRWGRLPLPSP